VRVWVGGSVGGCLLLVWVGWVNGQVINGCLVGIFFGRGDVIMGSWGCMLDVLFETGVRTNSLAYV
jgi:hypothetical protein